MTQQYDAWDTFLREYVVDGISLDLKGKNLNVISPKLWLTYPNLLTIDLSENPSINEIPEEFGNIAHLKQLRLVGCSLTQLPMSLLQLKDLNSLEVDKNNLQSFYDEQAPAKHQVNLENLSYLSLNGNQIGAIPSILKFMPKLKQLHMHMNRLTDIRGLCRREFENLEVVDVGQNKIRELPVAFVHFLGNLNSLTISNNDVEKLPPLLGFHSKLNNLHVDGNPLKQVRRATIQRGTDAILAYLKDRFMKDKDDIVEEWALLREKEHEDYAQGEYSYQRERYEPSAAQQPQQSTRPYQNQQQEKVGRLMNLDEFNNAQAAKQLHSGVFEGNDPNVVQQQIQDYVLNTRAQGYMNQE